jgi:flagellar protein FliS
MSLNLNQQQYNKYLEAQVKTASPMQLVCMLYDGAIKFANLAITGIKESNIEKKTVNIIKTEKIINELRISLNFDKGGEIAANLDKLYDFIYTYLIEANANEDISKLEHVVKILSTLRESWQFIANKPVNNTASSVSPASPAAVSPDSTKTGTYTSVKSPSANPADKANERFDLAC